MDTTKKKKSAPKNSKKQLSTPSQYDKYPALTERQIKSVEAIGWLEDKRSDIFLKKGAFWVLVFLLSVFTVCTIVAGFMGNLALAGFFGGGAVLTSAVTAGAKGLFAKAFGQVNEPALLKDDKKTDQKLLEDEKKDQ